MSGRRQARAQNKVGAGFGPSGGGGGGCGSVSSPSPSVQHLASMLNDLEVGQWQIPLANIRFTEHCRQTSPAAVSYIVDKIRQVGWMPTALPQVTLPGLNDGQIMTAELATTLEAFVLDGNHRLLAAREVFRDEPDKTITCTCYREITCTFTKKIISDACNDVSETYAKRSTYDNVFFFRTIVDEIVRARPVNSRKKSVTSAELRACWKNVKGLTPSDTTLRHYLNICKTFGTLAMQSLKSMTEEKVEGYDRITKNFLNSDTFKNLATKPREQALYLEIYARYPKSDGKIDKEAVSKQAHDVAGWLEGVERIVSEELWSDALKQAVNDMAFAKIGHYINYLKPHLQQTQRELRNMESQLPQHSPTLEVADREIILAKPLAQIHTILHADASLRPYLETYETKHAKTMNDINLRKLQKVAPSKTGSSGENDGKRKAGKDNKDDDEEEKAEDESDGAVEDDDEDRLLCATCNPPSTSKYCCPKPNCKVVHLGSCADTHFTEGDELSSKERPCRDCKSTKEGAKRARVKRRRHQRDDDDGEGTGEGKGKGSVKNKKKRAGDSLKSSSFQPLPRAKGAEDDVKIARRMENTFVHEPMPLSPSFPDEDIGRLTLEKGQAMLIFIPLSLHEHLLQENAASTGHLKALVYRICGKLLHPNGTVIVSLPLPYYKHVGRIVEHLQQHGLGLAVEDHGLVIEYGSRAGGLTAEIKKNNISGALDFCLVAHHGRLNTSGGLDFVCNKDVTPQNFPGRLTAMANVGATSSGAKRISSPIMSDVPHKESTRGFHDNVVRFAIQRWTNQGDTVVSFSAEGDGVVQCALNYGRRVEAFVATEGEHAGVNTRVEDAWEAAWRQGKFSRDGSDTNVKYIAHGSLPEGISEITTPNRILADVENANKNGTTALLAVAKTTAKTLGYTIKENEDALLCLHAEDGTRYPINGHEIPIWGKSIVYDSRQQALDSLKPSEDSTDLQFVRLVLVAEYDLLKRLCAKKEVVRSREAGLYIQVAQTCPAYYTMWDDSPTGHAAHEVSSYLKRSDTRETLLRSFNDKEGGAPAPAKLNVFRVIDAATPGAIVKVTPGVSVVRLGWYYDASAGGSETAITSVAQENHD